MCVLFWIQRKKTNWMLYYSPKIKSIKKKSGQQSPPPRKMIFVLDLWLNSNYRHISGTKTTVLYGVTCIIIFYVLPTPQNSVPLSKAFPVHICRPWAHPYWSYLFLRYFLYERQYAAFLSSACVWFVSRFTWGLYTAHLPPWRLCVRESSQIVS